MNGKEIHTKKSEICRFVKTSWNNNKNKTMIINMFGYRSGEEVQTK